ncbi:phosphopyruvate hydratase [Ureaplasma urealyticum]|uniref:phosphopyruvate hydratase n=1 Tax=Ureaplasma urealyticum TaxID=2130 RepID=UPI0001793B7E|nr:phosphopyruvate hydratase [Ureaplasma urealyticum]EDX53350.1 phosphopyruvate hydratase [Ureaplasma urealyticum serovar 12 str. ATCC 33696]EDY74853.1 phosphopyruvate hydratase [Ureaplasma urealyticum serovar 4 str. ATCC 27816]EEH01968.1 phosphopyruvate hydratase [Ureaplasma urealyticum serovar 2 str. ATCC 27814]MDU3864941.1 phosphopyruvate hydratase [Ureaplasma urealyticum]UIU15227.1 phosphopyruvate hydratase [Ureaplasma urealyticum]
MKIVDLLAYQVLDSRGQPTVAVKLFLENDQSVVAMVPSGASTGTKEALELRDGDANYFFSKSVKLAIQNVNNIIRPHLLNKNVLNFFELDNLLINLDGTENKTKLGANALLGVSIVIVKGGAVAASKPLYQYIKEDLMHNYDEHYYAPIPLMNFINGGAHADNNLDIQEFMIVPLNAISFSQAIQTGSEIFHELAKILKANHLNTAKGDEGGFAPMLNDNYAALELLVRAIKKAHYFPSKKQGVCLALDVAASELYENEKYVFKKALSHNTNLEQTSFSSDEWAKYWSDLASQFPIISIEDCFDENDWNGFSLFLKNNPHIQSVGDDLYCTNLKYLQKGINFKATNAILIKPNQIGTISETLDVIKYAQENNINTIISHRSGETEDTFIADFAIGVGAGQIKTGSLSRSERIAKYNRILEIEQELKDKLVYEPNKFFKFN